MIRGTIIIDMISGPSSTTTLKCTLEAVGGAVLDQEQPAESVDDNAQKDY